MSALERASVTVVMPNRNHGHYIAHALEAICRQSRRPERVVVIDDASTDHSRDVVGELIKEFPFIELFTNEVAKGTLINLNEWIFKAETEYVFCAAADDLVLPGFLERTIALLDAHPALPFATTASNEMDEEGQPLPAPLAAPSSESLILTPNEVLDRLWRYDSFGSGNTTVFRTAALRRTDGFPFELKAYADGYLLQSMALAEGCIYIPERLGVWRRNRTGNAGSLARRPEQLLEVLAHVQSRMRTLDRALFPEPYVRRFCRRWRYGASLRLFAEGRPEEAGRIVGLAKVETAIFRRLDQKWLARLLFLRLLADDLPTLLRRKLAA